MKGDEEIVKTMTLPATGSKILVKAHWIHRIQVLYSVAPDTLRKRFVKVSVVFGISFLVGLVAFLALLLGVATGDAARLLAAFTMVMAALVALGGILSFVVVALDAYVHERTEKLRKSNEVIEVTGEMRYFRDEMELYFKNLEKPDKQEELLVAAREQTGEGGGSPDPVQRKTLGAACVEIARGGRKLIGELDSGDLAERMSSAMA